jgi:Tol biopolymer transport system component
MLSTQTTSRAARHTARPLAAALLLVISSFFIGTAAAQVQPDRIAYDSGGQIVLMDADGSNKQVVNTFPYIAFDPSWSPDGKKLAFTCRGSEEQNICVVSAGGGDVVRLTDTGQDFEAAWSPKGDQIAFTSTRDGAPRLYVMNADGANEAPLAVNDATLVAAQQPAYSPGGARIAFSGDTEEGSQIYSVEVATGVVTRLSYHVGLAAVQPAYSPDGTKVAFSDFRNILTVPADGSGAEQSVTTGDDHDHYAPAYSADGLRLAYYKFEYILDENGERIGQLRGVFVSAAGGGSAVDTNDPNGNNPAWRPAPKNDPAPEEPTAAERVGNLINLVRGYNLPFGTSNSLTVKLRAALDALNAGDNQAACARLADFINHANAQSGKKLSAAQAEALTTEAASIRAALGCQ